MIDHSSAQVSMEIEARGDQTIVSNQFASRRDPIALGVFHVLDEHGAVHGQVNAIEGQQSFQTLEKICFQLDVGVALDGVSGDSLSEEGRLKRPRIGFERGEEWIVSQSLPPTNPEIGQPAAVVSIRAAFNLDTAERNTPRLSVFVDLFNG